MRDGRNGDSGKVGWRKRLAAARRDLSQAERVSEASSLVGAIAGMSLPETVCCYVPFGTEPGSVSWLDVIRGTGARVLLPVIPSTPGPLEWAEYTGPQTLAPGHFRGILEPSGPRLGPAALREAALVLVPALAVDHGGARLGRGAGHYDRSLVYAADDAALVAVVRDDELVDHLPAEPHDVRMTGALTPRRGLVALPIQ